MADRGNRRIQIFTLDGTALKTIKDEERVLMRRYHTQGEWMVCPDLDNQVCILDCEHKVVAKLGDGKAENGDVGSVIPISGRVSITAMAPIRMRSSQQSWWMLWKIHRW